MNIAYTQLHIYSRVSATHIHTYIFIEREKIHKNLSRNAMHFPNIFIRFFAFVSSFLFPKTHTTSHSHTTNQRNRRFYNSLLSSFPFPGSSCAASTQQRVQGTTPRIDEPLVPSPNLNEMNVEELDKESERERDQTLAVDYFPPVSK